VNIYLLLFVYFYNRVIFIVMLAAKIIQHQTIKKRFFWMTWMVFW